MDHIIWLLDLAIGKLSIESFMREFRGEIEFWNVPIEFVLAMTIYQPSIGCVDKSL